MQKIFGILLIVLAIWAGLEVYNEGTAGAFDGLFVRLGMAEEPAPDAGPYRSAGERAADRLRGAYQAGMDRGDAPERAEGRDGGSDSAGERTAARLRAMAGRD
jgi:hypothetical protein